jgi:hypothetical protein
LVVNFLTAKDGEGGDSEKENTEATEKKRGITENPMRAKRIPRSSL